MSSSRRRAEHIERIRYPNPLPLPPYPPKLLSIPTPASRFTDPRKFGQRLAQAHPLPVVVDAEAGMPINLTDFPQAWYTDQELEADDDVYPKLDPNEVELDPEDAFLLSDILEKLPSGGAANGTAASNPAAGAVVDSSNVTWLRRTEYLAAEEKKRRKDEMLSRRPGDTIDSSREAQIARINETFRLANTPLSTVRHPTKSHLKAVDSFSFLPDPDTWATQYGVFRFGDLPGRIQDNKPLPDPRLRTAILRPHLDLVGQPIYSLFLINVPDEGAIVAEDADDEDGEEGDDMFGDEDEEDGDTAERKRRKKVQRVTYRPVEETVRLEDEESSRAVDLRTKGMPVDGKSLDVDEMPFDTEQCEEAPVFLAHVRDYESHDESKREDQELILTFIDGNASDVKASTGTLPPVTQYERSHQSRSKKEGHASGGEGSGGVVYYHPVSLRASMRVRRRRANDPLPPEHWDAVRLGKRSLSMYEKIDRLHTRCVVDDVDRARLPARIEIPVEEVGEEEAEVEAAEVKEAEGEALTSNEAADAEDAVEAKEAGQDEGEEDDGEGGTASEEDDERSGSGSDGAQSDEEMDDDELAALQAEAGVDADDAEDDQEDGGRRRSRRAAAAVPDASGEEQKPREPLSMDVDEED